MKFIIDGKGMIQFKSIGCGSGGQRTHEGIPAPAIPTGDQFHSME